MNRTFVDILRERAGDGGERRAVTFLEDGERDERHMTYAELDRAARAIAAAIRERVEPGARALVVFPPGLDYVCAIYGCFYAGVVAVPLYPPALNRTAPQLTSFAADCGAEVALTTQPLLDAAESVFFERDPGLRALRWLAVDGVPDAAADGWRDPGAKPETAALLQYTSGSTAFPKGVVLEHGNLLANAKVLESLIAIGENPVGVSWLPPYHDMGLIAGLIETVYAGFPLVMMSPLHFLERPMRWMEAVARHRATATGGPNFAFDLVARRATDEAVAQLDLSSLLVTVNGAEPIRPATIERFTRTFAPAGMRPDVMRPCFGLAETTLCATMPPPRAVTVTRQLDAPALEAGRVAPAGDGGRAREVVGLGSAVPGHRVAIADPDTLEPRGDREIGEILVSGPSIARGYWGRAEDTAASFEVRLPGSDAAWLRTGDFGFLDEGELFWIGRRKDLIVISGRNVHPQDVELTAESAHAAIRPGCAVVFALDDEREAVGVVLEIDAQQALAHGDVVEAVRGAVAREHQIALQRVALVEPRVLPKTSSGKKQRRATRELLAAGELGVLHDWRRERQAGAPAGPAPTVEAVADWLAERIADLTGADPASGADRQRPLLDFGLSSIQASELAADLGAWLGRELSPSLVFDHPTIERLAEHLGERPAAAPRAPARAASDAPREAEPIAIVGVGCRFPGGHDLSEYRDLLRSGRDAIVEVPPERWDVEEIYDPDPDAPGKARTRWGAFVRDIDLFDPGFFGISPREARSIDPQQRMLLEVAWEALEDGGIPIDRIRGTQTGVFVGVAGIDYELRLAGRLELIDAHLGTGNAHSIAANRLSFAFDLRGPSMAVDTACSSSVVALHLACRSLQEGESDVAIAGGSNAIVSPEVTIAFSTARMLSPEGRSRPFDADANGYVRGEGCGVVVLKRLSDALRDGDRIRAVIRGSAVNQDGQTNGLTAPSSRAQQAVIRRALDRAGVAPSELSFFEAHGTGTPLGDPIEVESIVRVLGRRTDPDHRCLLGSVKANIGHLETAAGMASLVKLVLALEHQEVYPQANFERLNPRIDFGDGPLVVSQELGEWAPRGGRALAALNSFGFGGTNAALVVEQAPPPTPAPRRAERRQHVITLSGRTRDAVRDLAGRYAEACARLGPAELADASYTSHVGRTHFEHRVAVVGGSPAELAERLAAVAEGERPAGTAHGHARGASVPRVAFLFTGQGSQYAGMARELRRAEPAFRRPFEECAELLDPYLEHPLADVVDGEVPEALDATAYTQPALFAVEYALARMWEAWGIRPDLLLGHSIGEYVAACVGGAIELDDAAMLVAERARLMASLPSGGAMAALQLDEQGALEAIADHAERVSVAAVNGDRAVTIAGAAEAIDEIVARLGDAGVGARPLKVSHAFHSPLVEPVLDELERVAAQIEYRESRVPIVRNVDGEATTAAPDAAYWRRHARSAVRFADSMTTLVDEGVDVFVEVGPHPTLIAMGRRCAGQVGVGWIPSLRRGEDDPAMVLRALGELYACGVEPSWSAFHGRHRRRIAELPTYAFQRARHWIELDDGEPVAAQAAAPARRGEHPLLRQRLSTAHGVLQSQLGVDRVAYLGDHRVQGRPVVPATAFVEMALAAAASCDGGRSHDLREVELHQALFLPEGSRRVQVSVLPGELGGARVTIHSLDQAEGEERWTLHATCAAEPAAPRGEQRVGVDELRERCAREIPVDDLYAALAGAGLEYGPCFRGLRAVSSGAGEALAEVAVPEPLRGELDGYVLHPAVLDSCLHAVAAAGGVEGGAPALPVGIERVRVHGDLGDEALVHARLRDGADPRTIVADVRVLDADGGLLVDIRGLALRRLETADGEDRDDPSRWLHRLEWDADADVEEPAQDLPAGPWVVLADAGGVGAALAERVRARGARCVVVAAGERAERRGGDDHVVRPGTGDLEEVLRAALDGCEAPARIVHLWALDAAAEGGEGWLDSLVAHTAGSVMRVVQALAAGRHPARLLAVTRGATAVGDGDGAAVAPRQAALWGAMRSLVHEHPELKPTVVDLDPAGETDADALLAELARDGEPCVALRGDRRHVARLRRAALEGDDDGHALAIPATRRYRLCPTGSRALDGLALVPVEPHELEPGQVEVEARAAGLNFRDVLKAMGIYPGSAEDLARLGDECAGVVTAVGPGVDGVAPGDEVIAVAPAAFGSRVVTLAELVVPKPAALDFAQAATLPVAFMTAGYALRELARLRPGERCLIHAAAGGVGLAAVQIARSIGAEIYVTAGSDEKRELLRGMGARAVMDSRSLDFADEVMQLTDGEGVDVVLNSLAGEAIERSLGVLRPFGRFVEIGKRDIFENTRIGLRPFAENIAFMALDLDQVLRDRPELGRRMLLDAVEGFERGELEPSRLTRFPIAEAPRAFRFMAQGRHIGKIALELDAGDDAPTSPLRPDATFLVTGGLGGLGLALARRFVEEGARSLVLAGRREPSPEAAAAIEELRAAGADVEVAALDVCDRDAVAALVDRLGGGPRPLRGVVHAAGVLDDGFIVNLDEERLRRVLRPKALGAWNLHEATRELELDFFVLFSSATAVLGSPGQTAYAAGNAFLDALAERRRAAGLPAVSIQWGAWAEVGMAAGASADGRSVVSAAGAIPPREGMSLLLSLLARETPPALAALAVDWRRWGELFPSFAASPLLRELSGGRAGGGLPPLRDLLEGAGDELPDRLREHLAAELARVLELDVEKIDADTPLHDFGLDSLMALELKNRLEHSLAVEIPIVGLVEGPSLRELTGVLVDLLDGDGDGAAADGADGRAEAGANGRGRAAGEREAATA